jgi:hypothetical protein
MFAVLFGAAPPPLTTVSPTREVHWKFVERKRGTNEMHTSSRRWRNRK